ncbi:MAG TPA: flavin reductase family protein [Mycobacteriales bacterium]|nr:flavin reductase family protein [Mycobacteriales bacterium]
MTAGMDHEATPLEMRRVMGQFCSGITVVAGFTAEDKPVGFACQSFASVSLDPPLVLFCVATTSRSWPLIRESGRFAVNVLAETQQDVCATFGRPGKDKFADLSWERTEWGPSIDGVLATVLCDVHDVHRAGDHDIVVGHVRQLWTASPDGASPGPLLFFRGRYGIDDPTNDLGLWRWEALFGFDEMDSLTPTAEAARAE